MRLVPVISAIYISIIIILTNLFFLVFNQNFYFKIYEKQSIYSQVDKNTTEVVTKEILGYFKNNNKLENSFFSQQAIVHLKDVKKLFFLAGLLLLASVCLFMVNTFTLFKKNKLKTSAKSFFYGSLFTIGIALALALMSVINFQGLFILFHKIIFSNNLWQFSESDNLIKIFPLEFFTAFANQLIINIIITSALIATVSYFALKHD